MQLLEGILGGAPIWVWPLLVLLLFIGFKATKPRQTSVTLFYSLPLFGLMSLRNVTALPLQELAWINFASGYVAGFAYAYMQQGKWLLGKEGRTVSLAGEWFTMLSLMVIFWMNFVGGMMKALSPQSYESPIFIILFTLLIGAASGSFLGRGVRVIAAAPRQAGT
jgi:hypothetical protein